MNFERFATIFAIILIVAFIYRVYQDKKRTCYLSKPHSNKQIIIYR
jgi:hypothetical protein